MSSSPSTPPQQPLWGKVRPWLEGLAKTHPGRHVQESVEEGLDPEKRPAAGTVTLEPVRLSLPHRALGPLLKYVLSVLVVVVIVAGMADVMLGIVTADDARDIEHVVDERADAVVDLAERGLLAGGEKLADDGGRHLRLSAGRPLATDGPYAEAHDVIGGYFVVNAASDADAEALAQTCPHLQGESWIEIRRIEPT